MDKRQWVLLAATVIITIVAINKAGNVLLNYQRQVDQLQRENAKLVRANERYKGKLAAYRELNKQKRRGKAAD
ncbi:MAG: hypothetical protein ACK51E_12355 [Gemmatimonadota bacterium]|jgi:hypothetical protein